MVKSTRNERKRSRLASRNVISRAAKLAVTSTSLIALALGLDGSRAQAAVYYWDSDGTTAGFGNTTGTWGGSAFWSTSAAGTGTPANTTITTADDVNFGAASLNYANGTITGPATAQGFLSMTFGAGQTTALTISGGTLNLAATSTITQNSASAMTISSVLQGSGGLVKAGTGRLNLSGANTYTGTTAINAGVLVANSANAIPGGIGNTGGTGGLSLNGGILGLGAGDFYRTPNGATISNGTVTFTGNGGFAAYNANRVVNFGGTNSVTSGGVVAIGTTTTAGTIGNLNGKTLILGAASATHKVTVLNTLDFGDAARTIQVDNGAALVDGEISGNLQGQAGSTLAALTKTGTGHLALSGANTYTAGTTISQGTLQFAKLVSMPAAGAVAVGTGTTLAVSVGGAGEWSTGTSGNGTIGGLLGGLGGQAGGTVTYTGAVTLGFDTSNASSTQVYAGNIANVGTSLGILKIGTNTLSLTGTNTYTGTTTILGGTLEGGATNTLPTTGAVNIGANTTFTGNLDLTGFSQTIGSLTVSANSATANQISIGAGRTLTINGNVTVGNTTATGATAQTNLNFVGGGALVVSGAAANFEVGRNIGSTNNSARANVDLSALSSFAASLGTGTLSIQPNGDNSSGASASTLSLSNTANTITAGTLSVGVSATGAVQTLKLGTGTNVINANTINIGTGSRDSGAILFAGAGGSLTLRNSAGTGRVTTMTIGPTGAQTTAYTTTSSFDTSLGTADVAIQTLQIDLGAKTAANTNDVKFSAGTLDIRTLNMAVAKGTGASTNTVTINGGTVRLGGSAAFSDAGTGAVTLATAATGELKINGGTVTSTVDILRGTATAGSAAIITLAGGTLDLTGKNIGSATPIDTLNFQSGTLQNVGQINNGGSWTKSTTGVLTLAGSNTFTGTVTINDGTLLLGSAGALNTTAGSENAVVFGASAPNTAILSVNGFSRVIGNLSTNATPGSPIVQNANATPATLTVGNSTNASGVFAGVLRDGTGGGALSLAKAGTGTLTLSGSNTYTGTTTVNSGTLLVTGSIANTTGLSVVPSTASGATLSFINSAANTPAAVTALSLGSATGTTFLGLDLGTASDTIATSGAATAANNIVFNLNAIAGFGAGNYNLITAASGLTSSSPIYSLGSLPSGYSYSLNLSDSQVQLVVTAATAGSRYWRGGVDNSWATLSGGNSNWSTDAAGTIVSNSTPGASNAVIFSATSATGPTFTTTLDSNFNIDNLQFIAAPAGVSSVTINPGVTLTSAPGTLTIAPASASSGITLAQGAGAVTLAVPITLGATQTWSVDSSTPGSGTASSLTVNSAISGSGGAGLTFTSTAGTAPIILAGANTYSGPSTISSSTTVQGGATNTFSPNTAWTVNGTLSTGAFNQATGSLVGGSGIVQNGSATNATLSIGSDNLASATFSGTIQNGSTGTLGITKVGTGLQIISGTNTYTGTTTVAAGTLRLGGAVVATPVAVTGGTLQVAGNLPSAATVTLSGTGTFDLFGASQTVQSLASAATNTITNSSPSTAVSTATTAGTPTGTGIYVDSLTVTNAAPTLAGLITDGGTRKTQIILNNANASNLLNFTNGALNTFSGGLVLANNPTGTRLNINAAVTGTPFGTGPIILGQAATDKAGIYFNTADNTVSLPIVMNTGLGTDRFGIRNDGRTITLSGLITANADAVFSSNSATASNTIITNKVTGSGGLVLDLSQTSTASTLHTVTLNTSPNANDYAGDTVVGRTNAVPTQNYAATLSLGAADQIPNGVGRGNLVINSNSATRTGTLNLNGFSETINGLGGNGTLDGVSGTPTLTIGDGNATGLDFSGVIRNTAGTLTLTKTGSGTQTLSGASTFTGPINVNGGLIAFATSPATSGPLGNSTVVNLDGGGLSYTGSGSNALNRTVAIGAGSGTFNVVSGLGTLTVGSVTSTGGNLIKTGAGVLQLTSATTLNSGSGGVVVSGGTLQGGFGTGGIGSINVASGGTLSFQNTSAEVLTLGGSGSLTLNSGSALTFELGATGTNDAILYNSATTSGSITLNFLGLSGFGAGTYNLLNLNTGAANQLAGTSFVLGSAPLGFNYTITNDGTIVSLTTTAYSPIYWRGGQDLSWNTLGAATANWTTDSAGALDASSTPTPTQTVIFSATGAPTVTNTITTTLDAAFTIDSIQFSAVPSGITSVTVAPGTGGSLTVKPQSASGGIAVLTGGGNATISSPVTLDNTLSATQTWSVVDSGSTLTFSGNVNFGANVNKTGAGTLVLSGTNSGSGNLNLNAGTLDLRSSGALGGGTLNIASGTTLSNGSGSAVTLSGNGPTSINGDFFYTGASNLSLGTSTVTLASNPTITVNAQSLILGGVVGQTGGARSLTKSGAGTLVLDGNNTYTGSTTLTAGTLVLNGASAALSGVSVVGGTLNVSNVGGLGTGTLTLNGGTIDNTTGGAASISNPLAMTGNFTFAGSNNLSFTAASVPLTVTPVVTVSANTLTFSGALTGTGGITKAGPGTMTLSGTSTHTGPTTVSGGTLNVTGSLNNANLGNVVVTGGGTLNVSGSITGNPSTTVLSLGSTAGTTVTNVTGNITAFGFTGGAANGAVAVYNQTAGTATFTGNTSAAIHVANAVGAYGYLNITGGTFKVLNRFGIGAATANLANQSTGIVFVGGNGVLDLKNSEWSLNYSRGHVTVAGNGVVDRTGATQPYGIIMNSTVAGGVYGVINVAGGSFLTTTQPIRFGNSTTAGAGNNNVALINLAGGTLQVGAAMTTSLPSAGANNGYINFAGGTLKTSAAVTNWIPTAPSGITFTSNIFGPINNSALAGAPSFAGGLTVDTSAGDLTLGTALGGAAGNGVAQSSLTVTGGSGYVGAPEVVFTGGTLAAGGTPAAGYALISGGAVTGIVITSPGTYTAAPTVTLTGGGGTGASVAVGTLVANTSGGLTKIGTGSLILSSATSTFTGPVVINGGTVQANANGGLFNIGSATGGPLGRGDATSNATNAASIVIDGGTLSINNTNGAVSTDRLFTVTQNGATVTVDTTTAANTQSFTNTAPIAYTGSGARTLTLGGANPGTAAANVFSPQITNAGSDAVTIQKTGTAFWQLNNAANSYTGGTNIQAGTLGFASGALGTTGNITFTGTSALQWATGNTQDVSARLVMTNAVTSTLDTNGNNVTLASAIGGGTTGALTKAGTGTLTLSGANTYTGVTTIAAGTLNVGAVETAGTSGPLGNQLANAAGTILMTGGTLQFSAVNTNDYSGRFSTAGSQAWNIDTNSQNVSFATNLQGASSLSKSGAGTLSLPAANVYSGTTTVNGGVLNVSGSLINAALGNINVNGGGTLNVAGTITGSSTTTALNFSTTTTASIVNINPGANVTLASVLGSTGVGIYNQSGGSVTVGVAATATESSSLATTGYGYMNLTGGNYTVLSRFTVANGAGQGVARVGGGTGTATLSANDLLAVGRSAGSVGELTVLPNGVANFNATGTVNFLMMGNASNPTGLMNIVGGTVRSQSTARTISFGNGTSMTAGVGMLNLGSGTLEIGSNLQLNGSTTGTNKAYVNLAGGTIKLFGSTTTTLLPTTSAGFNSLANTVFGKVTNSTVNLDGTGGASAISAVLMNGSPIGTSQDFNGGVTVDTNGFNATISGALVAPTGGGVAQNNISISNAGAGYSGPPTVLFSSPAAANATPASGYAVLSSSGTLAGIVITSPGSYATTDTITVTLAGGGATTAATVTSIAGSALTANTSGGLTKTGAGTLTLSAANTYTGGTTVTGGILRVTNTTGSATGTGSVSINAGARLTGTGSIAGAVSVASSGVIAPGTSPGKLTIASGTLAAGSTLEVEVGRNNLLVAPVAGVDYDQLVLTGNVLSIDPASVLNVIDLPDAQPGDQFLIVANAGSTPVMTNTFRDGNNGLAVLSEGATVFGSTGNTYTISYIAGDGNDVVLNTIVPEPATISLAGIAAAGLLARRRRRSR